MAGTSRVKTGMQKLQGVMLRVKGGYDLDGYIFVDDQHAKEWLSQGFVNDDEYSVEIVEVTETVCCHKTVKAKLIQAMTVSAWLKAHQGK